MANRLSDQEALEFQFQGTLIDPVKVDSDARALREQLQNAIDLDARLEAVPRPFKCFRQPYLVSCQSQPEVHEGKGLTMEEFKQNLEDILGGDAKFDSLLEIPEGDILVDPIGDFQPVEYHEPWVDALIPTLIITFIVAAVALFLRDGIRRLLGRPKQRTGKWGIF